MICNIGSRGPFDLRNNAQGPCRLHARTTKEENDSALRKELRF